MIVGLDFGTTNSIISYWDNQAQKPATFSYKGKDYVPSAVAYEDGELIAIGSDALNHWVNNHDEVNLCRFFKPLLPLEDAAEWTNRNWHSKMAPRKVTSDYINHLLRQSAASIEKNSDSPISKLIVSVPELWHNQAVNTGAEELIKVLDELNMPEPTLISEPVAACAYYVWRSQLPIGEQRRVIICDMGGGTFDVSVCDVYRQAESHDKISVVAFAGNDNARAGVQFLRSLLSNIYNDNGRVSDPTSFEFKRDLWKLDDSIRIDINGERLKKAYAGYKESPEHFKNLSVFSFDGMKVKADHAFLAFHDIEEGIKKVLSDIEEQLGPNYHIDNILMVGGFSRYFMVRKVIADFFDLEEADSKISLFNHQDSLYAISKGASLIAAGKVEIRELYPHSIFYIGYNAQNDAQEEIQVIKAGSSSNKGPNFSDRKVKIVGRHFDLEGYILLEGKMRREFKTHIVIPSHIDIEKECEIGIEIDRSNLAKMVIRNSRNNDELHYISLGKLFDNGLYVK